MGPAPACARPLHRRVLCAGAAWAILLGAAPALAAPSPDDAALEPLVVGTKQAPPFAYKGPDGEWTGISIELWEQIAGELGYRFRYEEADLESLLAGTAQGGFDAAVAALTLTPDREASLDFTHPFYYTGLSIAVPTSGGGWYAVLRQFLSLEFLQVVLVLALILFLAGALVWFFERGRNARQFPAGPRRGLFAGFWWAAVTMTTVGYGDKAPLTVGGRLVALVWMFTALVVISGFTAAIASALTVGELEGVLKGPQDLPGAHVGTVKGSTSEKYLTDHGLSHTSFDRLPEALEALARGRLDGVVYDEPILRYHLRRSFAGDLIVLPNTFENQYYGIALPSESLLREPMNRALLDFTASPAWEGVVSRHLGSRAPGRASAR